MKLNNKGWETIEMVEMTAILFILLFVAAFYIYRLYNSFEKQNTVELVDIEKNITNAARNYYYDYGYSDNMVITYNELKEAGYMDSFYKTFGVDCNGYVIKDKKFTAYVKCKNMQSEGYDKKYQ